MNSFSARRAILGCVGLGLAVSLAPAQPPALRAYPDPIPPDVSFDAVVNSQPFPAMKYPVPIVGWKNHPEEVHVTPAGGVIFPRPGQPGGLYVSMRLAASHWTDKGTAELVPTLPDVDRVTSSLSHGHRPCVMNKWVYSGIDLTQRVYSWLPKGSDPDAGRGPLLTTIGYGFWNPTYSRDLVVDLHLGEVIAGHSVKRLPPAYPSDLRFDPPFLLEPDGKVAAWVVPEDAKVSFTPLSPLPPDDASKYTVLNAGESEIKGEYKFDVVREGETVRIGDWRSDKGVDLYVEASPIHNLPIAVDIEIVTPDRKTTPVGKLFRTGFSEAVRPSADYVAPGLHAGPVPWTALAKQVPQGASQCVLRAYFPVGEAREKVGSWEPIVYCTATSAIPRFKYRTSGVTDENRLRFEFSIPEDQSGGFALIVPYFPLPRDEATPLANSVSPASVDWDRYWISELDARAIFLVPELEVQDAYLTCIANNLLLSDRDPKTGLLLPHPDPTAYEYVWAGDSGVIIQAMDRMGYHDQAKEYLDYFLATQGTRKPDGDVTSAEGFFSGDAPPKWMDDNGFILWAMAEHYKLTGDADWLRKVAPKLIKSADWIIRERARTKKLENGEKPRHYGLLPKGSPSDIGVWDNWYWSDTYSYMGLRGAADVLAEIGMKEEAARLAAEADDYQACIRDSVERSINREVQPPFVPPSPYKNAKPTPAYLQETWYSICGPIYMVEAGLLDPREDKTGWIETWMERYGLYTGLPAFGEGSIDPYYVYNLSLSQLLRGETDKFLWTFYSLMAYGMSRGTYATIEGHNLVTGYNGEAWDANRQPHMHSNSRFVDLLRIAMVLEDGDKLHLLAGTPRGWLDESQTIEIRRAPTYFGEVTLSARSMKVWPTASQAAEPTSQAASSKPIAHEVVVTIEPPSRKPADIILHVRPPSAWGPIREVTVNGKPWKDFGKEQVNLGKLSAKMTVVCRF